jgi:ribonuclease HII
MSYTCEIGLDEAGRGAIIGPIVVAALACECPDVLASSGVRDSKRMSPGARLRAAEHLWELQAKGVVEIAITQASAEMIDSSRAAGMSLDAIERMLARDALDQLVTRWDGATIICDGAKIFSALANEYRNLRAENKADDTHIVVSAASIIAKTTRDAATAVLYAEMGLDGCSGNGYPNPRTEAALKDACERMGTIPPGVRRSWNVPWLDPWR